MVGSLLLAVALHGVDRPLQPMLEPVASDENRTAGRNERGSSLYAASESYYSGELECPVGCFAQPVRDDHAGILRHHLNKAVSYEDTAEEEVGENRTDSYKAMYKEIQVRQLHAAGPNPSPCSGPDPDPDPDPDPGPNPNPKPHQIMYLELSRWDHVIQAVMAAQSTVVHGDPMFKVNGTGTHFWLREGQLTPLLTWGGDGDSEKVLLGKTFSHPDAQINAQWFGEFAIMCKGKTVVEITSVERSAMNISFDGKHVRAAKSTVKAEYNSPTGVRLELTATENGEQASVEAGDMRVRIFASGAAKFARKAEQSKYSHLNLNFEFLPPKGKGIFAELSGLRPMSAATQALLKSPREDTPRPREKPAAGGDHDAVVSSSIRERNMKARSASLLGRDLARATSLVGTYASQLKPISGAYDASAHATGHAATDAAATAAGAATAAPGWTPKPSHSAADLSAATNLFGSARGARRRGQKTPRGLEECVCPPPAAPPGMEEDMWSAVYNIPPNMPPLAPGTSSTKDIEVSYPYP